MAPRKDRDNFLNNKPLIKITKMETQTITNNISPGLSLDPLKAIEMITSTENITDEFRNLFQQMRLPWLDDLF